MSDLPLFLELEKILASIYAVNIDVTEFPYDIYLEYLTFKAPLPAMQTEIKYSHIHGGQLTINSANINELQNVNNSFYLDFVLKDEYLSLENFMHVIYWLMCQVDSIVVISKDCKKILTMMEVARTIIAPFQYEDPYIPYLSRSQINYLQAPFP